MEKKTKRILCIVQILFIIVFMLIGALLGHIIASQQNEQLSDPEFLQSLAEHNFPVPEPIPPLHVILGFTLLFGGIPAGGIIFRYYADKWLTSIAPKIIIAFITLPIYVMVGSLCVLPMLVYKLFVLIRLSRSAPDDIGINPDTQI